MSLLLDTHAFLWWLADDPQLKAEVKRTIAEPKTAVYVSAASIWEISIKTGLGKIKLGKADLVGEIAANRFLELPVAARHAWLVGRLPHHHVDLQRLGFCRSTGNHAQSALRVLATGVRII